VTLRLQTEQTEVPSLYKAPRACGDMISPTLLHTTLFILLYSSNYKRHLGASSAVYFFTLLFKDYKPNPECLSTASLHISRHISLYISLYSFSCIYSLPFLFTASLYIFSPQLLLCSFSRQLLSAVFLRQCTLTLGVFLHLIPFLAGGNLSELIFRHTRHKPGQSREKLRSTWNVKQVSLWFSIEGLDTGQAFQSFGRMLGKQNSSLAGLGGLEYVLLFSFPIVRLTSLSLTGRTIEVVVGKPPQTFHDHERVICASSAYFKLVMGSRGKEAKARKVCLDEAIPSNFEVYDHSLYRGTLLMDFGSKGMWARLARACVLGEKLQDRNFSDAVMEEMLVACRKTQPDGRAYGPGKQIVTFIYANTPDSSVVRQFLVDVWASTEHVLRWLTESADNDDLPKPFVYGLAIALAKGRALSETERDDRDPKKTLNMCRYHQHGPDAVCNKAQLLAAEKKRKREDEDTLMWVDEQLGGSDVLIEMGKKDPAPSNTLT
jgi:hypothetical protein